MPDARDGAGRADEGRILALDPGTRRVGLAVSDPQRRVALGLPTFEAAHGRNLVDHLRGLLRAYAVTGLVVGLPVGLRGQMTSETRRVTALARRLRRELQMDVDLWDERLTTVQAERVLRGERAERGARDRLAAVLILQSYLDRRLREDR